MSHFLYSIFNSFSVQVFFFLNHLPGFYICFYNQWKWFCDISLLNPLSDIPNTFLFKNICILVLPFFNSFIPHFFFLNKNFPFSFFPSIKLKIPFVLCEIPNTLLSHTLGIPKEAKLPSISQNLQLI
ncbi:MAG: hypothetical protein CM15mV87_160 [Caudoviricetes sp.]|nr:MAG: hypothetical protein CM15mV87_160 [Caudoviricetes sp.]